jgi:hypothetical protein
MYSRPEPVHSTLIYISTHMDTYGYGIVVSCYFVRCILGLCAI